jgi:hypothetical protein
MLKLPIDFTFNDIVAYELSIIFLKHFPVAWHIGCDQ